MPGPSRREFLSLLALAGAGVACARGNGPTGTTTRTGTFDDILAGRRQELQAIVPPYEILSGRPDHLSVVLLTPSPDGLPVTDAEGDVWFAKQRTSEAIGPFPLRAMGEGFGERGIYAATPTFDADGIWLLLAEARTAGQTRIGIAQTQVGPKPGNEMPRPGGRAIDMHTPTVDNGRGVDPICTRSEPAGGRCAMHQVSLRDSLRAGAPTVMLIGTWAFCTSRFCGPEVDALERVSFDFDDVNFIHAEVLKDAEPDTVAAFQGSPPAGYRGSPLAPVPIAWNLTEEPAIYFIRPDGTIQERLLGAIDGVTMRAAVEALVG